MLNNICILGKVTRAPIYFQKDTLIASNFTIFNQCGSDGTFFNVRCYDSLAKMTKNRLKKGTPVLIQGRIIQDKFYSEKYQKEILSMMLIANSVDILDKHNVVVGKPNAKIGDNVFINEGVE